MTDGFAVRIDRRVGDLREALAEEIAEQPRRARRAPPAACRRPSSPTASWPSATIGFSSSSISSREQPNAAWRRSRSVCRCRPADAEARSSRRRVERDHRATVDQRPIAAAEREPAADGRWCPSPRRARGRRCSMSPGPRRPRSRISCSSAGRGRRPPTPRRSGRRRSATTRAGRKPLRSSAAPT